MTESKRFPFTGMPTALQDEIERDLLVGIEGGMDQESLELLARGIATCLADLIRGEVSHDRASSGVSCECFARGLRAGLLVADDLCRWYPWPEAHAAISAAWRMALRDVSVPTVQHPEVSPKATRKASPKGNGKARPDDLTSTKAGPEDAK